MKTLAFLIAALALLLPLPATASLECSADHATRLTQLSDFLVRIDRSSAGFGDLGIESAEGLHANTMELLARVPQMAPEQSMELCRSIAEVPELVAIPERLDQMLLQSRQLGVRAAGCFSLPPAAWNTLFITSQSLRQASIITGGICGATECISIVCKLPCLFKGIADSVALVAEAAVERADYCGTVEFDATLSGFADDSRVALDSAESRLDLLLPRVDVSLNSRASQQQLESVDSRAVSGFAALSTEVEELRVKTAQQSNQQQQNSSGMRRQLIETSLQSGFDGALVSLFLPASRGGLLEDLREQVAETLGTYGGLGVDTNAARALFAEGDAAFNVQNYRLAYARYRDAYRELTDAGSGGGAKQ